MESLLQKAVGHCPKAEVLWLMGAKSKWLAVSMFKLQPTQTHYILTTKISRTGLNCVQTEWHSSHLLQFVFELSYKFHGWARTGLIGHSALEL